MAADIRNASVLVVDDEEPMRRSIARILERNGHICGAAANVQEARNQMKEHEYAVVVTDMDMPGESGLDLIRELRRDYPDTATLLFTGLDDRTLARAAGGLGAHGYFVKPFEPNEIRIAVSSALRHRRLEIENRCYRASLEQMVSDRTGELWETVAQLERTERELKLSQGETIQRLSIAAEFRDDETARHIERMSRYCELLARAMNQDGDRVEGIRIASQMHDVGKIGIPDSILLKPGPLTRDERSLMQRHSEIGYRILEESRSELLNVAATIAFTHHERMDGAGYPRGLVGSEIPIEGRIAAIATSSMRSRPIACTRARSRSPRPPRS